MGTKLKVAVIGAGGIANGVHLPALAEIDGIEVAAICDIVRERAENTAANFGIAKTYSYYPEMLEKEKPDAVYCLVEPDRMFRVAWDCIGAGIPTFLEKPAGINTYQGDMLARQAEKHGTLAVCGLNRRHIPVVRYALKRIRELTEINEVKGTFIKCGDTADNWFYASAYSCDIIHIVDLVRHAAGAEPLKAATLVSRVNSVVDSAWSSVVRFENGVSGIIQANYQTGGRVHSLELHGSNASAFINIGFGFTDCEAKILHYSGKSMYSVTAAGIGEMQMDVIDGKQLAGGDLIHRYYGYKAESEDFFNCIRTGCEPLCPVSEAAKSMRFLEFLLKNEI